MTALKDFSPLEWGMAFISWCGISYSLFVNFKVIIKEQTSQTEYAVMMVRDVHNSYTSMVALLLTNESVSSCFHYWPDTKSFSKKMFSYPKCYFVPLLISKKFLPDYLLSLFPTSIIAEPTLFSRHRFCFLFILFLAPAASPHHKTTTWSVIRTVIFCQGQSLCAEEEINYATGPEKSPLAAAAEAAAGSSKRHHKIRWDEASSHLERSAAWLWLKAGTTIPTTILLHLPSLHLKLSSNMNQNLSRPSALVISLLCY